jgi:hypothetical protein
MQRRPRNRSVLENDASPVKEGFGETGTAKPWFNRTLAFR